MSKHTVCFKIFLSTERPSTIRQQFV